MCKGILSNSQSEDILMITEIIEKSVEKFIAKCAEKKYSSPFRFEISPERIDYISETGSHALSIVELYFYPTALQRVATLTLLFCTSTPCSITVGGKPFTGENRKLFISGFAELLIIETFKIISIEGESSKPSHLKWVGFPDEFFKNQFFYYIQEVKTLEVQIGKDGKFSQAAFEKGLGYISTGLAMALRACVKLVPDDPDDDPLSLPPPPVEPL
jgi:hypothetical protein